MNIIYRPSNTEVEAVSLIRAAIKEKILRENLPVSEVASRLKMLPEGFQILNARQWTLEVACRIAEALDIKVDIKVR